MKRTTLLFVVGVTMLSLPGHVAKAWTHSGYYGTAAGGGGSWAAHGYQGGTASGGGGSWKANGAYGGSAQGGGGSWSGHNAYGGSASGGDGSWNAHGAYGGSASGGYHQPTNVYASSAHYGGSYYGAYHPPTTVNYYGSSCSNCGGWNSGAAAATGYIVGHAVATAQANAQTQTATANAYAAGVATGAAISQPAPVVNDVYAKLPANCQYIAGASAFYRCGTTWLEPAFGANGVYYRVIPAP